MYTRIKHIKGSNGKLYPYLYKVKSVYNSKLGYSEQKIVKYVGKTNLQPIDTTKLKYTRCAKCGRRLNLTIDHKKPLSRKGTNNPSNLQILCLACNQSKSAKKKSKP